MAKRKPMKIKITHPGALTAKAKAVGESPIAYAKSHLKSKSKATRKQSQFAVNASKWNHKGGSRKK